MLDTRFGFTAVAFCAALCFSAGLLGVPAASSDQAFDGHRTVGVRKCATCHKKKTLGNQLAAWRAAPHARAFETLSNAESRALAEAAGLSLPPNQAPECLRCHQTGFGLPEAAFAYEIDPEDGVQCESCHGPGRDYRKKKIMSDPKKAHAKGLFDSDDPAICTACHNAESPTFDPDRFLLADGTRSAFDFEVAKKPIAHPIPEATKGHYLEIEKKLKAQGKKVE